MKNDLRSLTGVVVDAGHGGADSGATGNGIIEKDLTLEISKYMYDRFKELGIPVVLTRDSDIELSSDVRPGVILNAFGNGSDVVVISNHINAGGGEGAEVIYALRNTDALSKKILNNLAEEGQTVRKYYQRRLPSNPAKDYYYVIRETPNTEAIIVEYGFLDNANDAAKLKANYKDYAEAVVRAVAEYKGIKYVPVSGSDYYVVKSGDTLWTIAKNNGLSVDELKKISGLTSNSLSIGQVLKLSSASTPDVSVPTDENYYTVKSGDTLYAIANKYNMSVDELKKLNSLTSNVLSIGQKLKVSSSTASYPTSNEYYTVKSGDTLYSIASKYGMSVDELKKLNNLTSNVISIGQKLLVSSANNDMSSDNMYTVKSGDTLYGIASKYDITVDVLKNANNLASNTLSVGQKLIIPTNTSYNTYTVVAGDTLYGIAQKFGTSVDSLKSLNNLSSNILTIGQKLLIP